MDDYRECPHYKEAERRNAEWEAAKEAAKVEIIEGMRALGLVPENVLVQIDNAAATKADLNDARREARMYPRLQLKESREGNKSYVINPIHEQVRTLAATYAAMLRDLGFGIKTEKVITKIGDSAVQSEEEASADARQKVDDFRDSILGKL